MSLANYGNLIQQLLGKPTPRQIREEEQRAGRNDDMRQLLFAEEFADRRRAKEAEAKKKAAVSNYETISNLQSDVESFVKEMPKAGNNEAARALLEKHASKYSDPQIKQLFVESALSGDYESIYNLKDRAQRHLAINYGMEFDEKESKRIMAMMQDGSLRYVPEGSKLIERPALDWEVEAQSRGLKPGTRDFMDYGLEKEKNAGYTNVNIGADGQARGLNDKTGQFEVIPQSSEAQKQIAEERQKFASTQIESAKAVTDSIFEAIGIIDENKGEFFNSTGATLGLIADKVPFLDGYALARAIDTIQANLSFDKLQAIRDASKTGGGLGAISERELALLGSAVASLDPGLPADKKRANLEKVLGHYNAFIESLGGEPVTQPNLPPGVKSIKVKG